MSLNYTNLDTQEQSMNQNIDPRSFLRSQATNIKINNNTNNYLNNQEQIPEDSNRIKTLGLRDKWDQGSGLSKTYAQDLQEITTEYQFTVDTRNCVGQQSLIDAQYVASTKGIRPIASGSITDVSNPPTYPMVITVTNLDKLRSGDYITISGVQGSTSANGKYYIFNVVPDPGDPTIGTFEIQQQANADYYYTSDAIWTRDVDPGYPILTDTMSIIEGNRLIANLPQPLKKLRSLALYNIVIPRDIIPLEVYLSDFIPVSTTYADQVYTGNTETNYETFIKEEEKYTRARMLGFYSSPLDLWRAYRYGNMSVPDATTPLPLQLWNPPGPGSWPNQPIPYPYQVVPTYRSNDFTITGSLGLFHVILAGYGLYDLLDWTSASSSPAVNALVTSIMRKLLLILICPKQSYRDADYVTLILSSNSTTPNNLVYPYGYGDYQRLCPGPGLGCNYQPCTIDPINPRIVNADSPIPFPNYSGNVWGPYSGPGARFQNLGTRTTIQDLYLNGDLNNLSGESIVLNDVPTENFADHVTYGLNFLSLIEVNLSNIQTATNPNITNAMRITSNGFGTATVRANGGGTTYENKFRTNSGGQGPSSLNAPSTWSDQSQFGVGTGSIDDPIAKGPLNGDLGPDLASATTDINDITKLTSFYDLGPNNGQLITNLLKFIDYAVNDIPDTDLIIQCDEINADRGMRSIATYNVNGPALIDCAIRLSIGSANGTQQYIESVASLVSVCNGFWETRFMNTRASIRKLHFSFFTFDGTPIPLEKMLQQRRTTNLLTLTNRLVANLGIDPLNIPFLFDPLDPRLINRVKRYFQMILKIVCYEMSAPGLAPESYTGIPPYVSDSYEGSSYT